MVHAKQQVARGPSRRDFLKTSLAVGAGYWISGSPPRARASRWANEQLQFACIGVDGKGKSDSLDAARFGNIMAICDIDEQILEKAAGQVGFEESKQFFDFREMLAEMGDSIDAVTVSTPDHTHAVAAVMAMNMGKHCFCQKPLTHSISEARKMAEVAVANDVKTQMGNQGTALRDLRRGAEIMRSGCLGAISEVHVWTNRPVWPQGMERPPEEPVPDHIHWDLWLGPAPDRPYSAGYHPFKWRGYWDFGTGALGDMGCHTANMPFMALDLRDPTSIEAETSGHNQDSFPGWSKLRYEFPARDNRGALIFYWYDGDMRPDEELIEDELIDWMIDRHLAAVAEGKEEEVIEDPNELMASGCMVIGDKGKLFSPSDYGTPFKLLGIDDPDIEVDPPEEHFAEWVSAMQNGTQATSNFPGYATPLTETILLGNLAVWSGGKIDWDAKNMTATNAPELQALVQREYRDGYSLEAGAPTAATS